MLENFGDDCFVEEMVFNTDRLGNLIDLIELAISSKQPRKSNN